MRKAFEKKVKQQIRWHNLIIKLYAYDVNGPKTINSNIEAFDLDGNLVWRAENCNHGRYWEMQIDEELNRLETNDGGGMHYEIDVQNGAILSEGLIK